MSSLFRLEIVVNEADFSLAQALLGREAQYGWEEENLPDGGIRLLVHSEGRALIDSLLQAFKTMLPQATLHESTVEAENWVDAWRDFFTPVHAGEFLILPPWLKDDRSLSSGEKQVIVIEPKSAFGTGHHPSTTLCLEALTQLHAQGRVGVRQRFLDLGTGSGVLGIAAARLGLTGLGLDIDPEAVNNALENRAHNEVSATFEVAVGSVDHVQGRKFNLVFANILANPLKEMASRLIDVIALDGCLILSGILEDQAAGVEAAYAALGPAKRLFAPSLANEPGQKAGAKPEHWACLYWGR